MPRQSIKTFSVCLVACLTILSFACSDNQLAKATKVGRICQFAVNDAGRLIPRLVETGNLSEEEAQPLIAGLGDVSKVVAEYNTVLSTLKADDPATPGKIAALVESICESLDRLQAEGVLKIKNEATRRKLTRILFVARSIAGTLAAVLADNGYGARPGDRAELWPEMDRAGPAAGPSGV